MQKKELEQIFEAVCSAFPRGNITVLNSRNETVLERERLPGAGAREVRAMRKEATVEVGADGHDLYRISLPLGQTHQLCVYLPVEDYPDAFVPARMLEALLKLAGESGEEERRPAQAEENPLLNSLLYADTMEMRIYASLLAEEEGKNLELPRVVCLISDDSGRLQTAEQAIRFFRETGGQDICGRMGESRVILCRRLEEGKSIRQQCDGYLGRLYRFLRDRYGLRVRIWVGTAALRPEQYHRSLEAAVFAGKCARRRVNAGHIVYAADYILEYAFYNTDPALLKHFLERYAEGLRREPELVEIAEALLENNMNLSLAAAQRFMHRNTMAVYFKRLKESLALDPLRNDGDRFLLMLICLYYRRHY